MSWRNFHPPGQCCCEMTFLRSLCVKLRQYDEALNYAQQALSCLKKRFGPNLASMHKYPGTIADGDVLLET
jgi:hypothetical protein